MLKSIDMHGRLLWSPDMDGRLLWSHTDGHFLIAELGLQLFYLDSSTQLGLFSMDVEKCIQYVTQYKVLPFKLFCFPTTANELKREYHKLATRIHPDKTNNTTTQEFRVVLEQYEYMCRLMKLLSKDEIMERRKLEEKRTLELDAQTQMADDAERKYEKFVATNTFVQEPTLERTQQQVQEPVAEPEPVAESTEVPTDEYQLKYRLVQVPSKDFATEKSHRTRKRRRGLKGKSNDEKVPGFSDLSEYERLVRIFNALERFGCFKRKSGEQLKEVKRYKKSTEKFGSDVFMDFMFQEKHFDYNDVVKVRPSVKQVDFNRVRGYRSKFEHENITKESFMKIAFEEF